MATTKAATVKEMRKKYCRKRFGSYTTTNMIELRGSKWYTHVVCDCGEEFDIMTMCLSRHTKCTCGSMKERRTHHTAKTGFAGLIKLWPAMVAAGKGPKHEMAIF